MMNMTLAETFGDIPTSSCDDIQALLKMNTHELLPAGSNEVTYDFDDPFLLRSYDAEKIETKPLSFPSCADHTTQPPVIEDLVNETYNFNVRMKGQDCKSATWFYSTKQQKLYVKKKTPFTLDVSYDNSLPHSGLYVRVMVVCSSPQDIYRAVYRCPHDIEKDHAQADRTRDHFVRCLNPEASYIGTSSGVTFADRLAMLIVVQGTSEKVVTPVSLEFQCQNSCTTIERRATSLVFTLENEFGAILGRKSINVKICSCPKRDMEKEEKKGTSGAGSKRKIEVNDSFKAANTEPPRKLTRQSSHLGLRPARNIATNQRDSPVPSTSAAVSVDIIKKETPFPLLSRSSSTISNTAVENDSSAIVLNLRLPDIATVVKVVEFAFNQISGDIMSKGSMDEETGSRLSKYLAHCRRMKRDLEKSMEENIESAYDSE